MNDAAAISLYELFFDIEEMMCQRYTALTPFQVRREKFGEVTKLLQRINTKHAREKGGAAGGHVWKDKRGNTHIRRQATNDNWY